MLAVEIGQVVPGRRVGRGQIARGLPLRRGAIFVVGVFEKAAVGQAGVDVFGMEFDEVLVFLVDALQTLLDARVEGQRGGAAPPLATASALSVQPRISFSAASSSSRIR